MRFTDNFSDETKAKAEELKQQDLNNREKEKECLINELIEQMGPHLLREEDKLRKEGMSEENIKKATQKKAGEILSNYNTSIDSLQKGIDTLRRLNNFYVKKDEMVEGRSR